MVAVLARYGDRPEVVRRILERIGRSARTGRSLALSELLILAGLRSLEERITQEAVHMPLLNDIMDHKVFGPKLRRSREEGCAEEARLVVVRQAEKRFGTVPAWAIQKLEAMSVTELEDAALRLLDVRSIEELFN